MKIITPSLWLVTLALGGFTVSAAPDQPKSQKPATEVAGKAAPESTTGVTTTRVLTGSYIPQRITQSGRITDGPNNVQVISARTIQLSGAGTLPRALGVLGASR